MFVVKHKDKLRYVCGTKSKKADRDSDELVSLQWARIYPSIESARSGLSQAIGHHFTESRKFVRNEKRAAFLIISPLSEQMKND